MRRKAFRNLKLLVALGTALCLLSACGGTEYETAGEVPHGELKETLEIERRICLDGDITYTFTVEDFIDENLYTSGTGTSTLPTWGYTDFIDCESFIALECVVSAFNAGDVALKHIVFFDEAKQYICGYHYELATSYDGVLKTGYAIPENAKYVKMLWCTSHEGLPYLTLYKDDCVIDVATSQSDFTEDKVLHADYTEAHYANWYTVTAYCSEFDAIKYNLSFFAGGGIRLCTIIFYDGNGNIISDVSAYRDLNGYREGYYKIPTDAKYVRALCCVSHEGTPYLGLVKSRGGNKMNVLCIGDSLTEGDYHGGVIHKESYPYYLQKYLGEDCTVYNAGRSGYQAVNYWSEILPKISVDDFDVVAICLGANGSLSDTFEIDVDAYEDYNDYANTMTGCYCKIIEYIMENNPEAQIVLLSVPFIDKNQCPALDVNARTTNALLSKVVERYHFPVIDLYNEMGVNAKNTARLQPVDGVHGNEKYYSRMGTFIGSKLKSMYSFEY